MTFTVFHISHGLACDYYSISITKYSSNSYAIKKKMSSEIDIVKFSIKCILECRNNDELIYFIQFLF